MHAKVTGEYYTVLTEVGSGRAARQETREGSYTLIAEAVEAAMRITLDRKIGCSVQRITLIEPQVVKGLFGEDVTINEVMTGEIPIPGPRSYTYVPELSRYHAVNGWVIPETIDIPDWRTP